MKPSNNFVPVRVRIIQATALVFLPAFLVACNERAENNPNVVASPSPVPTQTVVVPSPVPTQTVVVSPSPQPTTTVVVTPTPSATNTATIPSEPITNVTVITTTPNQQVLVDRQVKFTDVQVQSVVGDRTFWVGSNNNERLFVVLAEPLDAGAAENQVVVKSGQTLDLTGMLRPMPTVQQAQQQWSLSPAEAQALQNQTLYLQAQQINRQES